MAVASPKRQVNIRVESALYKSVESIARRERRTVPQTVKILLEEGLRSRATSSPVDDIPSAEIAKLAAAGGAFDWLNDEPDLYDESCGEPA